MGETLFDGTQQEFFFAGIDGVKFRRPVVPGDQLVMKVVLTKMNKRFGIAKMKGQCLWARISRAKPSSPSPSALKRLANHERPWGCLLYTSPSPRDATLSRMPSSA